ncbi:uncharacterized protein BDV14DRAFT_8038 [Aspergillus stella-maris]|uniref:uncharacterized protein n=1 Tax=Aspergillus stella-maris TaxID=1810926 RepID=UPI003CCCAC40
MSTPTGQFSSLSIRGSVDTDSDTGTDTDSSTGTGTRTSPVSGGSTMARGRTDLAALRAPSGLVYDLRGSGLDRETEARALLGLTTDFEVLFCGLEGEGYEFVFGERVRVRIDGDEDEEGDYTCTCAAFRGRRDVACPHIFQWLLDQLRGQLVSAPPTPSKILLSSDGHAQGLPRIEHFLSDPTNNHALEMVAKRLNWPYLRSIVEKGGMSRTQRVRDILSAFSTSVLPEGFRPDIVEPEDDMGKRLRKRTPEQCIVQGDFEATLFRLAVHDDSVFASLCKAMPPGACAAIYFDKVLERSRKALSSFDKYCQTLKPGAERGERALNTVLSTLRTNALNIHRNIINRTPHGLQIAAKTLTSLLEDITSRNKDGLANNQFGRTAFTTDSSDEEDGEDRNLYYLLIGSQEDNADDHFCLDALSDLPGEALYPFRERLETVLRRVEVNRAPRGFIHKLAGIVRAAERGTGSVRKRGGRSSSSEEDGTGESEKRKRVR